MCKALRLSIRMQVATRPLSWHHRSFHSLSRCKWPARGIHSQDSIKPYETLRNVEDSRAHCPDTLSLESLSFSAWWALILPLICTVFSPAGSTDESWWILHANRHCATITSVSTLVMTQWSFNVHLQSIFNNWLAKNTQVSHPRSSNFLAVSWRWQRLWHHLHIEVCTWRVRWELERVWESPRCEEGNRWVGFESRVAVAVGIVPRLLWYGARAYGWTNWY
jgi:hypothetical protein